MYIIKNLYPAIPATNPIAKSIISHSPFPSSSSSSSSMEIPIRLATLCNESMRGLEVFHPLVVTLPKFSLLVFLSLPCILPYTGVPAPSTKRRIFLMGIFYVNPEIAAHNIASSYCNRQIQQMPDENFIPGDMNTSIASAIEMWKLYATIYDAVFEEASKDNCFLMEEK